ncbi:unnamed protein product [Rotaria sp. Silwood2]|nr:unnamed protein product [Rotaria sp. Silwood2]
MKLIGNALVPTDNIVIPDELEVAIENELECLKERLKVEELESEQIQNEMRTVLLDVKGKKWKSAISTLEKILKMIRPLNIQELFRLAEKVDEAAELMKGKDVILLLEGTGAGKSTTIHFLGGSKLVETKVKGMYHIHAVEIKNEEFKKITTTPFARSETRFITPVTVNYKDVGGLTNDSFVLCDSPGFEDTSGPEVDIANGFGIVKAIKGSKSVKPVILISY